MNDIKLLQASIELRLKLEAQLKLNVNQNFRCTCDLNCVGQVFNSIRILSAPDPPKFDSEVELIQRSPTFSGVMQR